jgi:Pectic acid lyase
LDSRDDDSTPQEDVRRLVTLSLRGLQAMQRPDGLFCHERSSQGTNSGRSIRYSLMCYLGLLEATSHGYDHDLDTEALRRQLSSEIDSEELKPGDLGLYLWADATGHSFTDAEELAARAERAFAAGGGTRAREGQEVAWLVIGLSKHRDARATSAGQQLLSAALDDLLSRTSWSGLLYHYGERNRRRRFANFATQIYGVLALATAAKDEADRRVLEAARRAADRLLALQLEDGGWPWLYDVRRGGVVERYEIYSVHQHAMAPMALLELAEVSGDRRYVDAAVRGLAWIHGRNELGVDMVDEPKGLIYRSIRRKRPFDRTILYANTALSVVLGHGAPLRRVQVELQPTCRPYELGWLLAAWCGREHLAG